MRALLDFSMADGSRGAATADIGFAPDPIDTPALFLRRGDTLTPRQPTFTKELLHMSEISLNLRFSPHPQVDKVMP